MARLSEPGYDQTYWQFLSGYFRDFSDLSGYFGTFTPGHLWFILYLLVFSLAGLHVLLALKKEAGTKGSAGVARALGTPWTFLSGFVLLTATEVLPDPGGKNPFFYFFLFLAGYITCADERFSAVISKLRFRALMFLIPYLPVWLVLVSKYAYAPDWSPASVLLAFMRNLALWLTLIVIVGYGARHLNLRHRWLPYLNRAAFPVYVVHQTVLLAIGFFIVRSGIGVMPKFLMITGLSLVATYGLYELVIRRAAITRWLFGVKVAAGSRDANATRGLNSSG